MTAEKLSCLAVCFLFFFAAGSVFGYWRALIEYKRDWDVHFRDNWIVPREKKLSETYKK